MAWDFGYYYLAAGQSGTWWVTFGDAWAGLQYISAVAAGGGETQMYVTAQGIQSIPRFGAPPLFSYWVDVENRGPSDSNFVLRGERVD